MICDKNQFEQVGRKFEVLVWFIIFHKKRKKPFDFRWKALRAKIWKLKWFYDKGGCRNEGKGLCWMWIFVDMNQCEPLVDAFMGWRLKGGAWWHSLSTNKKEFPISFPNSQLGSNPMVFPCALLGILEEVIWYTIKEWQEKVPHTMSMVFWVDFSNGKCKAFYIFCRNAVWMQQYNDGLGRPIQMGNPIPICERGGKDGGWSEV